MPSPSAILKYITDGGRSNLYRWEVMRVLLAFMVISNRKNLLSFGFAFHNFSSHTCYISIFRIYSKHKS